MPEKFFASAGIGVTTFVAYWDIGNVFLLILCTCTHRHTRARTQCDISKSSKPFGAVAFLMCSTASRQQSSHIYCRANIFLLASTASSSSSIWRLAPRPQCIDNLNMGNELSRGETKCAATGDRAHGNGSTFGMCAFLICKMVL